MPMFVVNTNVAKGDVPPALVSEATEELAKALGKPVQVGRNFSNPRSLFIRVHSRFTFRSSNTNAPNGRIFSFAGCQRSREIIA